MSCLCILEFSHTHTYTHSYTPTHTHTHTHREQQSSHKSSTSPLSPSSSGHSSPRSPPTGTHPPPPTSHPPPLPAHQQSHASMVTNKSRSSHVSNAPKMSGSAINQFPSQDRQNDHPRTAHTHGSRTKGGHFGSRGQAGGKTHVSETHHQSTDSKVLQPARNSPGAKPYHFGPDGHHFGLDPRHSSKLLPSSSEQSSLESTPMSSEASTPVNEFHNDQGERGSPSGASTTSLNSLRQQDMLQASNSDPKLSPYNHNFAGDLSGLESKSDTKPHYASSLPKRSESFSGSTSKQHTTTSVSSQHQSGQRHQFGKFPPSKAEQSSLASVSLNYQQQAAFGMARQQHQRPTVALRVSQFNQNGNHSGGTTQRSNNQGQSPGASGQGGGGRNKTSPVDDKRGVKWRKDKTPSPGNARSPENTVGSGSEDRSVGVSRVRGGGGEGKREKSSNLPEMSPSSSMEELSEINVPASESDTDSAPLIKPHVHKSSPHYSPYLPPPPPPPPPAHPSEPQYPYEPPYDPYVRPDLQSASSTKYSHQKQHPGHGYPPPHDYRYHVPTSKSLRTEQHMKSSISLAHEAAAKGDVVQLVSGRLRLMSQCADFLCERVEEFMVTHTPPTVHTHTHTHTHAHTLMHTYTHSSTTCLPTRRLTL